MAHSLTLKVVTPEALFLEMPSTMVVIPAEQGDMGILHQHAPVMTTLRPGVMDIYDGDTIVRRLFVWEGYANINHEQCTILCERCFDIQSENEDDLTKELEDLREALKKQEDENEALSQERDDKLMKARLDLMKRLSK